MLRLPPTQIRLSSEDITLAMQHSRNQSKYQFVRQEGRERVKKDKKKQGQGQAYDNKQHQAVVNRLARELVEFEDVGDASVLGMEKEDGFLFEDSERTMRVRGGDGEYDGGASEGEGYQDYCFDTEERERSEEGSYIERIGMVHQSRGRYGYAGEGGTPGEGGNDVYDMALVRESLPGNDGLGRRGRPEIGESSSSDEFDTHNSFDDDMGGSINAYYRHLDFNSFIISGTDVNDGSNESEGAVIADSFANFSVDSSPYLLSASSAISSVADYYTTQISQSALRNRRQPQSHENSSGVSLGGHFSIPDQMDESLVIGLQQLQPNPAGTTSRALNTFPDAPSETPIRIPDYEQSAFSSAINPPLLVPSSSAASSSSFASSLPSSIRRRTQRQRQQIVHESEQQARETPILWGSLMNTSRALAREIIRADYDDGNDDAWQMLVAMERGRRHNEIRERGRERDSSDRMQLEGV